MAFQKSNGSPKKGQRKKDYSFNEKEKKDSSDINAFYRMHKRVPVWKAEASEKCFLRTYTFYLLRKNDAGSIDLCLISISMLFPSFERLFRRREQQSATQNRNTRDLWPSLSFRNRTRLKNIPCLINRLMLGEG